MTERRRPGRAAGGEGVAVPRRGRPRDPTRDVAIGRGVLRVMARVGYRDLTMDAVAPAAGVGKATIYRRWSWKDDLLLDVIEVFSEECLVESDTGSLRGDLVVLLNSLTVVLAGPGGGASRAVLGVLTDGPALAEAYRRGPLQRWAGAFAGGLLPRRRARRAVSRCRHVSRCRGRAGHPHRALALPGTAGRRDRGRRDRRRGDAAAPRPDGPGRRRGGPAERATSAEDSDDGEGRLARVTGLQCSFRPTRLRGGGVGAGPVEPGGATPGVDRTRNQRTPSPET